MAMNEDRKKIVRAICTEVDPQNIFDWIIPTVGQHNMEESTDTIHIMYGNKRLGFVKFDGDYLKVGAGYRVTDFELANPHDFEHKRIALYLLRCLCYELVSPSEIPPDWRIELVKKAGTIVILMVILGSILMFVHLLRS